MERTTEVKIYPNPVVETLNVVCAFDSESVTYAIYDFSGKQVYVDTDAVKAGAVKSINVSNLVDGVYILKVASANNTYVHHFVKK